MGAADGRERTSSRERAHDKALRKTKSFTVSELGTEPQVLHRHGVIPPPEHTQKPDGATKATAAEKKKTLHSHRTGLHNGHGVENSMVTAPAARNLNLKGNTVVSEPSKTTV